MRIPAAQLSSIMLPSSLVVVLSAVRIPLRWLALMLFSDTFPLELTNTIPSLLPIIQLSSINKNSSPSTTKIPSLLLFSMQLYLMRVLPDFIPPRAMLALMLASILLARILAQEPSTIRIPQLKLFMMTLGLGKDLMFMFIRISSYSGFKSHYPSEQKGKLSRPLCTATAAFCK